jgi:hypothetical protein
VPPRSGNGTSTRERARSTAAVDAQDGLFDHNWEDPDLVNLLEEREEARDAKAAATREYQNVHDRVKTRLLDFHLEVGEVARIGRFKIKKRRVTGNSVSFETQPREQLDIGTIDEAE